MAKRNTEPSSMSDALKDFVSTNNLQKGMDKVDVAQAWFDLNPAFKTYTQSVRLDRDTLIVSLSSSVFREELSYGKEKIIARLNDAIGREVIKKIVLR